jgi:hypothetical protein
LIIDRLLAFLLTLCLFSQIDYSIDWLYDELRIDVAARTNAEARFNAPPHQSELN